MTPDRTTCPLCSVGCSLAPAPDEGRAAGRAGAVNPDGRLCPKGIHAYPPLGPDDERLTTPLVREDGALREASWAEALDRIEAVFGRVLEEAGPDALAFLGAPHCTTEENYLFARIARTLGTNNVDNRARICHASVARAMDDRLGSSAMTNGLADLREAEAFLVAGANPADRQPVAFDAYVRPAVNAGAALVHVDPRATATTRLADVHLAARPGTDALVFVAMAAVVVQDGLVDEGFVADRTTGFEAYAARLADVDVAAAADAAGVPEADLREAARTFADADGGAVVAGTGVEADDHEGTAAADALLNLLLLTGNLGRPGAGMNLFRGLNNEQGAGDAGCEPFALPGRTRVDDPDARARVAAEWGVEPPATPGRSELDLVEDFGEGVRAAWVFGEDPARTRLDDETVRAGMAALDCLVVQDVTWTPTVERADVVLPGGTWTETDGTVTNLDRQVQRMRASAEPPGDARRDLDVLCDLGARLTDAAFDYDGPRDVFAEFTRVAPTHAGMTWDAVSEHGQRWPLPAGASVGTQVLHEDRFSSGDRRTGFVPVDVGDALADTSGTDDEGVAATDDLVLVTSRAVDTFVGETTDDAVVQVHPADATARGLAEGDAVAVVTDAGRVAATVAVTDAVREGTVYLPEGAAEAVAREGRTPVRLRDQSERRERA